MGDFENAVKQLGLPACPECGEIRQLEHISHMLWSCRVCRSTFPETPPATAPGFETHQPRIGLFKVLPR